jgi:hypothetical protein
VDSAAPETSECTSGVLMIGVSLVVAILDVINSQSALPESGKEDVG